MKPKKEEKAQKKKSTPKPKPEKPVKDPKAPKLRKVNTMIIVRNIVVSLVVGIFVMCLVVTVRAFTRGDGTQSIRAEMQANTVDLRNNFDVQTDAKAFAQNFIKDYFTYQNRDINDYRARLERYCTPRLASEMIESVIMKDSATALYVQAIDAVEYSKNQYDITVVADVMYTRPVAEQSRSTETVMTEVAAAAPKTETTKSTFYIIVPVWSDGQGGYVIEDIPMLTAPVKAAGYERQDFSGTSASEADKTAAQQMLNDFFKTLYSEPQTKIDYYLADNAVKEKFTALELGGDMSYQRIENLVLYKSETLNEFTALVTIKITDSNGTDIKQRFNMQLVKKDKFYAKDINLRTYSLK